MKEAKGYCMLNNGKSPFKLMLRYIPQQIFVLAVLRLGMCGKCKFYFSNFPEVWLIDTTIVQLLV